MTAPDFDAPTWEQLRRRTSVKWRHHPPDVLPMFIAEMDVPLAAPVTAALHRLVELGDAGYAEPSGLAAAFGGVGGFAARRFGWEPAAAQCLPVPDVMSGVADVLRVLTPPGAGVVICPPVYHPFFVVPADVGRTPVEVPLDGGDGDGDGALDLAGIDAALAAGARAVLLGNPHNPTGRVWTADELDALAHVAARHDALVVSDEIHAPLTLPGAVFTPYLAGRPGVAVHSASKAFNLAGLKSALVVADTPQRTERLRAGMPEATPFHCGLPGVAAAQAAFDDGDAWLDALLVHLDRNRTLLGELLAQHLPQVRWTPPQASFLAWLDTRDLGPEPVRRFLDVGRVALVDGAELGRPGFSRLNFGTTETLLREGVRRMAAATAATDGK